MPANPYAQSITVRRGEDPVIPVAPAAATPCPAAMAFTAAAEPEGEPLFAELTVGAGITITDQPAGEFTLELPRVDWAGAGEYVWSLFDLDGDRTVIAAGVLLVEAVARRVTA